MKGELFMFQYKVQTPGLYEYSHLNKPVEFSEDFLKNLKLSHKVILEDEHDGPEIGEIEGVYYNDGILFIQTPKEVDMHGKGFSTVIKNWVLEDKGDRFIIVDGVLERVARTGDPKDGTTALYNSNEGDTSSNSGGVTINTPRHGGNDMADEAVRKLEQEIGGYKNQLNSRIDENLKLKDEIKDLKQQLESKDTELLDKDKVIKEKEDKLKVYYQKKQEKQEALAKELAGDDDDLFETYKDIPLSKLEVIREKQKTQTNTGFQGTGDNGADDQDNGEKKKEEKPLSYEDWKNQQNNSW
jgi:regulator of replication initiation timing